MLPLEFLNEDMLLGEGTTIKGAKVLAWRSSIDVPDY